MIGVGIRECLPELIKRVEGGTGWDSRLDGDIMRAFGFTWRGMDYWHADNTRIWKGETCFTAKIDAGVSLIEQKLPGWFWRVGYGSHAGPWAHLNRVHPDSCLPEDEATSYAKTPPRALLAACLRAIQAQAGTLADAHSKNPPEAEHG